jgi:hypothetical protein
MTDLALDRTDRVRLLGEAAQALLDGRLPEPAARIFLASAISAWLARGGNLERDHLKVVKAKSHHTPAAIWRQIVAHQDERHGAESGAPSEHHQLRGTQK